MDFIEVGNITIEVVLKDIKNVHLSVYPPAGRVRISAPQRMELDTIRIYAISKLRWIKKQQTKIINQDREAPREFLNKESHFFKGKRYLMKVIEHNAASRVELKHSTIEIYIRPGTTIEKRKTILDEWYRQRLKELIPPLIKKYEPLLDIQVNEFGVKKMKTRWGTCNREAKRIWVNLELVKKPPFCLEHIIVHEMVHFIERRHNDRFVSLMDVFLPKWRFYKDELNRLPVSHENWSY